LIEHNSYPSAMGSAEKDRILLAQITGIAHRYASVNPTGRSRATAVTNLAEQAAGRSDLLAEAAGIAIGCHEGELDEARYLAVAQLCVEAGADQTAIPSWIAEGRRRAETIRARRRTRRAAE
jgi:hypothetical protein